MAGENLGAARLLLQIDATDFEATIARSKNAAAGLGAEAEAAFTKADARAKRAATSLLNYVNNLGKGTEEQRLLNAALKGTPVEVLAAAKDQMNLFRIRTEAAAKAARELKDADAFAEQAADAAKLVQASNYVRFWEDALEQVELQQAKMAADNRFIASLREQAAAVGKTRAELLELKAAEMGLSTQAAPYIAQLKAQEKAITGNAIAFNQYGLSAKQTQAALRQVPAQITDIFVSLQGGQAPLTVLLQQGGQLRDVFGGIGPAARALGAGLLALINPITILGAAAVTLGVAFFKGRQEALEFNKALILSGNIAGQTSSSLTDLARDLGELDGQTQASASAAINEVVRSGRIGAEQLELVTRAALAMNKATGKAVKDTVSEFVELGKSPVEAILRLNEGQNFLTDSTLEQIRALEDQGRRTDAARVAQEAYADSLIERGGKVRENLGTLEQGWDYLAQSAREAWSAMLNVGREGTLEQQLADVDKGIEAMEKRLAEMGTSNIGTQGRLRENLERELRDALGQRLILRGAIAREEADAVTQNAETVLNAEMAAVAKIELKYEGDAKRRARERALIEETFSRAYNQQLEAGNREMAAKVKERERITLAAFDATAPKGPKGEDIEGANRRAALQAIKDALDQERAAIANGTQALQAEFTARLITQDDYYKRSRELLTQDTDAQEQAIQKQIALLQGSNVTGKDAIDIARQITTLEAQLAKVRADGATALSILGVQEKSAAEARTFAINQYGQALARANETLAAQVNASIAAIGLGTREADQQRQIAAAYDERDEALRRLQDRLAAREIDRTTYDAEVELQRQATEERVRIVRDGFARMLQAQGDWLNGVRSGLADWVDGARNTADQTANIITSSLDRSTDALVEYATTGKDIWRQYLADILTEIVKFFAKRAVLALVELLAGAFLGGSTGSNVKANPTPTKFAKGAAISDSPSLSAYSGTVVSQPTPFKFAKGAGIMGEAGDEGIFPLKRGSDGKLGVVAHMAGGSGVTISVQTVINNDGSVQSNTQSSGDDAATYKQFTERMRAIAQAEVYQAARPGGILYRAGVSVK